MGISGSYYSNLQLAGSHSSSQTFSLWQVNLSYPWAMGVKQPMSEATAAASADKESCCCSSLNRHRNVCAVALMVRLYRLLTALVVHALYVGLANAVYIRVKNMVALHYHAQYDTGYLNGFVQP